MKLIGGQWNKHGGKVRELYEAVKREQAGVGEDTTAHFTVGYALREIGVDEAFLAKKLKEQLDAKQPRWNPRRKKYELVPDNDARLAAIREAIKFLGGYPIERDDNEGPVLIDFTDSWASPAGRRERVTEPTPPRGAPDSRTTE